MSTRTQLTAVLTDLADLLDTIPPERDGDPTPCTEYTVGNLRAHVIGWLTAFADGFAAPDGACSDPQGVRIEGDGADQVRSARDRIDASLADGAAERPLLIGGAGMPGNLAAQMIVWEYQVHGWDLARAAGRPWAPDVEGVEASLVFAPGMLTPDFQGNGKPFAPLVEIGESAPPLDRLVGLSGRDPNWSAPAA